MAKYTTTLQKFMIIYTVIVQHGMDDGREEVDEDDGGSRMEDMGIDSEDSLEEDSEYNRGTMVVDSTH